MRKGEGQKGGKKGSRTTKTPAHFAERDVKSVGKSEKKRWRKKEKGETSSSDDVALNSLLFRFL